MRKVILALAAVFVLMPVMMAADAPAPADTPTAGAAEPEAVKEPQWYDRVKWVADLRLRYEIVDQEDRDTRNRMRIRARFGGIYQVNDEFALGLRLRTNPEDPVSSNVTLGDDFEGKLVGLDLAYVDYAPKAVKNLHILGGKIENPFVKAGKNELIFDNDLTPEGAAVKWAPAITDGLGAFVNAGAFFVNERSEDDDATLFGGQGGLRYQPEKEGFYVLGGGSIYHYTNTEGFETFVDEDDSAGNFTNPDGTYLYGFNIVEPFIEMGAPVGGVPMAVYGSYARNTEADEEDTGWVAGVIVGKLARPGDWAGRVSYRELEANAVVGAFSGSDFIGGGTGGEGWEFGVDYQVAKNVTASLTYLLNEIYDEDGNIDYDRIEADLAFRF